jgi:hypothetical protein
MHTRAVVSSYWLLPSDKLLIQGIGLCCGVVVREQLYQQLFDRNTPFLHTVFLNVSDIAGVQ